MKKKKNLSLLERQTVYSMRTSGYSDSKIAKKIYRDRSTVWRERKRNAAPPYISCNMSALEKAKWAQDKAKQRRSEPKKGKRGPLKLAVVRTRVEAFLKDKNSPEKIATILSSSDLGITICGRTIRRWINTDVPELKQYLPCKGKVRKKSLFPRRPKKTKIAAPETRNIRERCEEADNRSEPGHLEGDTIVCDQSKDAIVSVADRFTDRRWYRKVPNLKAETVFWALFDILSEIPPAIRRTITFDNGGEFALWYKLERIFGILAYFCDPYCSWQKPVVERSNKEFRLFVPKGTDLSRISPEEVQRIEQQINSLPMDRLDSLSSADVWLMRPEVRGYYLN